jgi:hypothetical protein
MHNNALSHKAAIVGQYLIRKRLTSFLTLIIRQILRLLEKIIKRENISGRLFSSV